MTTEERPINSVYLVAANHYVAMLEQPPNREVTRNLAFVLRDYLKEETAKREIWAKTRQQFLEDMGVLYDFNLRRVEISQYELDEGGNECSPQCLIGWHSEDGEEHDKLFGGDTIQEAVSRAVAYLREQEAKHSDPPEYEHPLSPKNLPF